MSSIVYDKLGIKPVTRLYSHPAYSDHLHLHHHHHRVFKKRTLYVCLCVGEWVILPPSIGGLVVLLRTNFSSAFACTRCTHCIVTTRVFWCSICIIYNIILYAWIKLVYCIVFTDKVLFQKRVFHNLRLFQVFLNVYRL